MQVRVTVQDRAKVGESPVWSVAEQALYWVDINGPTILRYRVADGAVTRWPMAEAVGCIALDRAGRLIAALRSGLVRFDPQTGAVVPLVAAPYDQATQRFNDGKVDPQGRLWVGTIFEPRTAKDARLYRFDGTALVEMAGDVIVSNGLAWSPDGATLYHSDTRSQTVYRYAFDGAAGTLRPRQVFATVPAEEGRPDGAAMDVDGGYWSCQFAGGRVYRFAPDGTITHRIDLPVSRPTMCAFGGPGLDRLYITSATEGMSEADLAAEPLAGSVLEVDVGHRGVPVPPVAF